MYMYTIFNIHAYIYVVYYQNLNSLYSNIPYHIYKIVSLLLLLMLLLILILVLLMLIMLSLPSSSFNLIVRWSIQHLTLSRFIQCFLFLVRFDCIVIDMPSTLSNNSYSDRENQYSPCHWAKAIFYHLSISHINLICIMI